MLTYRWTQGNTHTLLSIGLVDPYGNPVNISGVTTGNITLKMRKVVGASRGAFTTLTGSVTSIANAAQGIFTYQFSTSDVAIPGRYELGATINFGAGDVLVPFLVTFIIEDA